ncbi:hypothetical protein [Actinomadura sp. BRA 177]|uniref:hypothetical protein n=1 Tax=Actinomadura sp. BRA 177 TaxID=2745202 RepID=UPI0015957B60|nr:hypothetical protein [Actinomadura sp. BRA 177]NVI88239.1 hypothetical protein [Actinomadura sp. BRA 177]
MRELARGERDALQAVAALITIVNEPAEVPDGGRLNEVMDAVVTDLGRARDVDIARAVGIVASLLLDRLESATGRGREELWTEIVRGITAGTIEGETP